MNLKDFIHNIPDFPQAGVLFRDISPLLQNPKAFTFAIEKFADFAKQYSVNKIAAVDSRGFIFASALAVQLQIPFILIRKKGKLAKDAWQECYSLEYGEACLELQKDDVQAEDKILIIDDVLATGGTAAAAQRLIKKSPATVVATAFLIELLFLDGAKQLDTSPYCSLIAYE